METAKSNTIRKWYVLRTFSGHEKKVKEYLEQELERLGLTDKLPEIMIPTETVFEMRGGKKRTREKNFFPGYILLNALLDKEVKHIISGVPSVVGFLTTGDEPTALRPDEVNRINRIRRRDTNSILLRQADAKRYALALEVSVNRLLAGELTVEESAASGGNEGAKKAGKSKQEDLTVRKKVGSERLQALKKALGRRSYGQLHSDLTAAQKQQWSLAMVKSYVLGKAFPNKEFLTDVAHVLGVSVISLTIRDSPLENLGRRCITGTISDPGKNHAVLHIPGIPVTITSEGLGLNHKDHIDFDVETRSFAGQIFRVTGSVADGYSLTATIPLGEVAKNALLGLVTQ